MFTLGFFFWERVAGRCWTFNRYFAHWNPFLSNGRIMCFVRCLCLVCVDFFAGYFSCVPVRWSRQIESGPSLGHGKLPDWEGVRQNHTKRRRRQKTTRLCTMDSDKRKLNRLMGRRVARRPTEANKKPVTLASKLILWSPITSALKEK